MAWGARADARGMVGEIRESRIADLRGKEMRGAAEWKERIVEKHSIVREGGGSV